MPDFFLLILALALAASAWALIHLWKGFLTHNVTVSKVTDAEETVVFTTNFSVLDSPIRKRKKLDELFQIAEERIKFTNERMQARIRQAQEENKRLKEVK